MQILFKRIFESFGIFRLLLALGSVILIHYYFLLLPLPKAIQLLVDSSYLQAAAFQLFFALSISVFLSVVVPPFIYFMFYMLFFIPDVVARLLAPIQKFQSVHSAINKFVDAGLMIFHTDSNWNVFIYPIAAFLFGFVYLYTGFENFKTFVIFLALPFVFMIAGHMHTMKGERFLTLLIYIIDRKPEKIIDLVALHPYLVKRVALYMFVLLSCFAAASGYIRFEHISNSEPVKVFLVDDSVLLASPVGRTNTGVIFRSCDSESKEFFVYYENDIRIESTQREKC